ncbi:FAD-dependent oxidoreductase [Alkalicoccus luteus]|uniref:SidA/IucD/PvdA family monooxygenase n=1 Tax=Alkalicoccus luteus TaxID=1237094 RepID=A0A969PQ25_9BACI|nr:FAD-dependent oxidoreductase [Alkalicoccus luteus]NJP38300.1 SidA/IucD/PvdA family monooxygenase [Alkalicoccus luteus]
MKHVSWLIVGGGIQGMTAAVHLRRKAGIPADKIAVIDPHAEPLAVWKERTEKIRMPYLRSSFVHHLSPDPLELEKRGDSFLGRYKRPSRSMFYNTSMDLLHEAGLQNSWIQDTVVKAEKSKDGWKVYGNNTIVSTTNLLLAPGGGSKPIIPEALQPHAVHVYDPAFDPAAVTGRAIVVGGGISAAHTAVFLAEQADAEPVLLHRRPLQVSQFDSDPGWLGPKRMQAFSRMDDRSRRTCLHQERRTGSMTRELLFKLRRMERAGRLTILQDEAVSSTRHEDGMIELALSSGCSLQAETVTACTGFSRELPGSSWLKPLIEAYSLPCADCGYPKLSPSLMWTDRLYVTGALAELEIGPSARNIAGAQRAARRIVESASM